MGAPGSTREEAERWFFDVHGYMVRRRPGHGLCGSVCYVTLIAAFQVIPDVMDEEWLGQANAAVDIALSSDGFNEFNSGGES